MTLSINGQNAILGALVADAATMGLHWLYDQQRIRELAPETPEFRPPNAADYEGVPGYFAHIKKEPGDLSQYGEQAMVMLRCLAVNGGIYNQAQYQNAFYEFFGYGGSYVGYIDRATRGTLNNAAQAEVLAMKQSSALPFSGADDVNHRLIQKVLSCAKHANGTELRSQVEQAVRITDDTEVNVAHALKIVEICEATRSLGANDRQLPATAKLPALIACYTDSENLHDVAESAIRVTSNNDFSATFGLAATDMIESAILTGDPERSVMACKKSASREVTTLLDDALARRDQPVEVVTRHFGLACDLDYAVPSVAHNLATSNNFVDAIRRNIYAGGDNCGRSIILGAVAGACYGVGGSYGIPQSWLDRVDVMNEAIFLIDRLNSTAF